MVTHDHRVLDVFDAVCDMEDGHLVIRAGRGIEARMPVTVLMNEHEEHGMNLARLRKLTGGLSPPEEACSSWRKLYEELAALEADLMIHIHLENNVLFSRPLGESP